MGFAIWHCRIRSPFSRTPFGTPLSSQRPLLRSCVSFFGQRPAQSQQLAATLWNPSPGELSKHGRWPVRCTRVRLLAAALSQGLTALATTGASFLTHQLPGSMSLPSLGQVADNPLWPTLPHYRIRYLFAAWNSDAILFAPANHSSFLSSFFTFLSRLTSLSSGTLPVSSLSNDDCLSRLPTVALETY